MNNNSEIKIIYDFGANNGSNIEYYLHKADIVVVVEANSLLTQKISHKFSSEIAEGRLFVENGVCTVDRESKNHSFYLHKTYDFLSTMIKPSDNEIDNYDKVKVILPSINPLELIYFYGEPYYIKIDLEGFDHVILEYLLLNDIIPPYISAESHVAEVFCLLVALGKYEAFKLVDGSSVQNLYKNILINSENNNLTYNFPAHSAGPFGNDIIGDWMSVNNFFNVLSHVGLGWKDIHASKIDSANINYIPKLSYGITKNINF